MSHLRQKTSDLRTMRKMLMLESEADARYAQFAASQNFTAKQRINKVTAANAWLHIGSGTGTLTDKSVMGTKIKLDTTPLSGSLAGSHINLNIIDDTPTSDIHGLVSRIEVNDNNPAVTGDTVALWGDVKAQASSGRNLWGLNTFVTANDPNYAGALIGAEIGVYNNATAVNRGGVLHLVSSGSQHVRHGLLIHPGNMEHAILVASGAGIGPITNLIYFGPLGASNTPTGTPLFMVDAAGNVTMAGLRIDQMPVQETPTPTHTFVITLNGTAYRVPCVV